MQSFEELERDVTIPEEKRKVTVLIRVEDASETQSVRGEIGQFRLVERR